MASTPPLTQYRDCNRHSSWTSRTDTAAVVPLIRDDSVRVAQRTGLVRVETIRSMEAPAFVSKNFTLEISRRMMEQPWFDDVVSSVRELLALGRNWNGFDEEVVDPNAIKRAIQILKAVGEEGPRPSLVPMPDGSVQIEWTRRGQEIKILVPSVGSASAYISDPASGDTEIQSINNSRIWSDLKDRITIRTTFIRQWAKTAVELAVIAAPNEHCSHYVARVESCQGAWAYGDSPVAALIKLESVLFGWAHLKLRDGDTDIPSIEGIDLVAIS